VSVADGDVALVLLGVLVGAPLYGVLGVGVGALVRNQVAAIVGALAWILVVENLVIALLPDVGRWLPGGAAAALAQLATPEGELLPAWAGGLVFLAYGVVFAVLGTRFVVDRDVT
jgi:ABC-2 type transport system permease protein